MAKVPFSKLEAKVNNKVEEICYCNLKGEKIIYEVKYYLPIQEKMEMISNILNYSVDTNGYYNSAKLQIYTTLEIVYAYTNLNFTDKQKENIFKLYDQLISTGIFQDVINKISQEDWKWIQETLISMINNIYNYKNSIAGILDILTSEDYTNLSLDAEKIQKLLGDPENMSFLREVLAKLG